VNLILRRLWAKCGQTPRQKPYADTTRIGKPLRCKVFGIVGR
jgi:hypothetical protein